MHRIPLSFVLTLWLLWGNPTCTPQPAPAPAPAPITSAAAVLQAMQTRYAGQWYATLMLEQTTIQYNGRRPDTTRWEEAFRLPGYLRIDVGDPSEGNGMLFADDSLFTFEQGRVTKAGPVIHPLLLLGLDVYFLPLDTVSTRLERLGFDLSVMHEATWQGRPVYVVGAAPEDDSAPQFWIDQERLVFVRMRQPVGNEGERTQEVQFNGYHPLGTGWIAPEVRIYTDTTLVMAAFYHHLRPNVALDARLFDPAHWTTARHGQADTLAATPSNAPAAPAGTPR